MHDFLIRSTGTLNDETILSGAAALSLDRKPFDACLAVGQSAKVDAHTQEAAMLGITSTPAFLLGVANEDRSIRVTTTLKGTRSIGEFKNAIDALLLQTGSR